jgi:uncharacterized protein (TIGR00730 family)
MADSAKTIAIFGTSKAKPGEQVFEDALQLGRLLAENGFAIANGGYGGTMLAAAKGAAQASGQVIGVTCKAFGRSGANEYVTRDIQTDTLEQRLKTLVDIGDDYIVLPGSTGTLLELATVWEFENKGFTNNDKSIIIIGPFWQKLISMMESADSECSSCIKYAQTPRQAVEMLIARL